ncbi:hypothetical protein [Kitasatospora sp. NPDC085879]|uniref:hypothetical protein n=1 Tax=Kitasatospora sp. NPDC085879 TaxID=3154769 RepID=UPI00343FE7CF
MGAVDDEHGTVKAAIAWLERRLPDARARRERLERELAEAVREEQALHGALDGLRALTSAWTGEPVGDLDVAALPPAVVPQPDGPDKIAPAPGAAAPGHIGEGRLAPATAEAESEHPAPAAAEDEPATAPTGEQRGGTVSEPAKRTVARKAPAQKSTATKTTARKTTAKAAAGKPARGVKQDTGERSAARDTAKAAGPKPAAPKTAKTAKPTRAAKESGTAARTRVAEPDPAPARSRRSRTSSDSVLKALAAAARPLRARDVVDALGLESEATNAMRTTLERLAKTGQARKVARGTYTTADTA